VIHRDGFDEERLEGIKKIKKVYCAVTQKRAESLRNALLWGIPFHRRLGGGKNQNWIIRRGELGAFKELGERRDLDKKGGLLSRRGRRLGGVGSRRDI